MEVGKKYKICFWRYQENGSTWQHEFVGVYLGMGLGENDLDFNLRPAAGTVTLDKREMVSCEETDLNPSQPARLRIKKEAV